MGSTTSTSIINYYEDELDHVIAETLEHYEQCNIRFRSPNRNTGPTHKQKYFKPERES